jgi:two-component system nitrogen regulation response regulator GlnG/two-component system response regulator AtoC
VLVIEDDPGIRHMLGLAIESLGHEARLEDGQRSVDGQGVDAVILDIRLGDRTGLDLLEEQPELQQLPLIVTTAGGRSATAAISGALALAKPFDLASLETALGEALACRSDSLG